MSRDLQQLQHRGCQGAKDNVREEHNHHDTWNDESPVCCPHSEAEGKGYCPSQAAKPYHEATPQVNPLLWFSGLDAVVEEQSQRHYVRCPGNKAEK
mmetsp:Transcript_39769/g.62107  ORF Transcript_39769/g.62107 Transcript_39769/m.62107 type:complete len:96 (+) Transcript_39769:664-951(+)